MTYDHFSRSEIDLESPPLLDEMVRIAKRLSEPFPFARVDFYTYDQSIILGEMTFFPSSGLWPIIPEEYSWDNKFGSMLALPEANHNLDLLQKLQAS